jgi:predicted RNA-binding Zn-ribbon protein involved in translation (DUF1610 family)
MDESAAYKSKVYCDNCGFSGEVEIQKGKKISERACPQCGTLELKRDFNVDLNTNERSYFNNGYDL